MKIARIINAIVWTALLITICIMVAIQWHEQGCEIKCLVVGCLTYTCMITAIGFTIDQTIKEYYEEWDQ